MASSDERVSTLRSLVASGDQDAVIAAVATIVNQERSRAAAEAVREAAAAGTAAAGVGLAAAAAPHPVAASSSPIAHKFKFPEPPKPEAFYGDFRKAPNVRSFLFQLDNYFAGWPELTEAQKLYFASLYLKGSALLWWQSECHNHRTVSPFATCAAFKCNRT